MVSSQKVKRHTKYSRVHHKYSNCKMNKITILISSTEKSTLIPKQHISAKIVTLNNTCWSIINMLLYSSIGNESYLVCMEGFKICTYLSVSSYMHNLPLQFLENTDKHRLGDKKCIKKEKEWIYMGIYCVCRSYKWTPFFPTIKSMVLSRQSVYFKIVNPIYKFPFVLEMPLSDKIAFV